MQARHRQCTGRLGNDALILIQVEQVRAHRAFGHGVKAQALAIGVQNLIGQRT